MKKCKITVMRMARYDDLIEKYENPIEHACDMCEGQVFFANGWEKPDGMCDSAWESMSPFVLALSHGGENFYDGWMKNKKSAMISCNDGFRPVSFYIEALEEDADITKQQSDTSGKMSNDEIRKRLNMRAVEYLMFSDDDE